METAIFSVVYPGMETYFPEFLDSLAQQTFGDFTLFLINDGLSNIMEFLKSADLDIKVKDARGTPAALRKMGIKWVMKSGAKVVIFADSDDYFAKNRIEICRSMLAHCDIVFNELVIVNRGIDGNMPMLDKRFNEGDVIFPHHLKAANCMGLSNTALSIKSIPHNFEQISENIIAFDWALFALCLHANLKGVFTKSTATYYRQHDRNLAILFSLKDDQILQGVKVKRDHYELLNRFYKEYEPLANQFGEMLARLQSDPLVRKKYCQAVRRQSPSTPLWWESIISLEEAGL